MVSPLCEAYSWSLKEAMSYTLPQIIMLNHAAYVNRENSERRYEAEKKAKPKFENAYEEQEAERVTKLEGSELTDYLTTPW
jgi:hypothetical protein